MNVLPCIFLLSALRVAFVGDPQVDNPAELEYARKSVYSELRNRNDLDLVVVLGDLVNENPSLIVPSEASLDSLGCPWARVNGNHDGPCPVSDTTFIQGGIRFILMNNVRLRRRKDYEGGLREDQKIWLDSLMHSVPEDAKIVFCTHIPVSQSKGRDSLSNIMARHRNVLFVCGHTHSVDRKILGRGVEEVQAGASCGSWWRGRKDSLGIPYALMNCGAPKGYFVADFHSCARRWYSLDYKCIGREASERCSVTQVDGKLYVNVYGGSREGRVSVKLPGRPWMEVPHCYVVAPEVRAVIDADSSVTRECRKARKEEFIPLRRLSSPHVWVADRNVPASTGKKCRLRYRDGSMTFQTYFCLK